MQPLKHSPVRLNEKAKSQREAVQIHLINLRTITSLQAIQLYGCTRLASVIHRLRTEGMTIETKAVNFTNAFGNASSYAKYVIITNRGIL